MPLLTALRAAAGAAGRGLLGPRCVRSTPTGPVHARRRPRRRRRPGRCLCRRLGRERDLRPETGGCRCDWVKGEILRLRAAPGPLPCERIVVGERFYLVPGRAVRSCSATSEEGGSTSGSPGRRADELLREAHRALPQSLSLELVETAGRAAAGSPDNTIIGSSRGERSDPIVAAGLYRNGTSAGRPGAGVRRPAQGAGRSPRSWSRWLRPLRPSPGGGAEVQRVRYGRKLVEPADRLLRSATLPPRSGSTGGARRRSRRRRRGRPREGARQHRRQRRSAGRDRCRDPGRCAATVIRERVELAAGTWGSSLIVGTGGFRRWGRPGAGLDRVGPRSSPSLCGGSMPRFRGGDRD